jgi:exopolyphosphatase/guanosine-5'-triphosphate,3'-diphosphate pyrophosphatase
MDASMETVEILELLDRAGGDARSEVESAMALVPLAAIDVGSNTVHLTVARPTADGFDVEYLADELELVRLGADVSRSGEIGPERMARAVAVVAHQAGVARAHGAERILGIATEGVRAAANGAELLERVRAETGVTLELISGEQEAALTYWGAVSGLEDERAGRIGHMRRAVLDLGGGSLELVVGEGSSVRWRVSLPLGSGTLHDRFAPSDPARPEELAQVRAAVLEALTPLDLPLPVGEALAAGGTATTLAALAARALTPAGTLAAQEAAETREAPRAARTWRVRVLTEDMLHALVGLLQARPAAEIARRYGVEEARARLLGAGATVLLGAMERLGAPALHVRRRGIREGALLAYCHRGEDWLRAATDGAGW